MPEQTYRVIAQNRDSLGECPLWCEKTSRLWWVDVLNAYLWSYDPATGGVERHEPGGRRLGSIALRRDGGLLLARDDGLFAYDPETRQARFLIDPEPGVPGNRKNDGRVDPAGRFWIGTLDEADYGPRGALYRVDSAGSSEKILDGLRIPNALAFSPDEATMYFADTRQFKIWSFCYDQNTGAITDQRLFAETTAPSRPDGSCIDAQGYLWNAEYAGSRVVRYDPSGRIERVIDLPVSYPTCCCFGGPDLTTLFVTSASFPLDGDHEEPLAGSVIAFEMGITGLPERRCRF